MTRTATRATLSLLLLFLTSTLSSQANLLRTLTGTVRDRQHEPIRGAVVEVQDEITNAVVSYITDSNGQYSFKRLSPNDDYKAFATFRGHKSKPREMSHFDSKPNKVLDLIIELD